MAKKNKANKANKATTANTEVKLTKKELKAQQLANENQAHADETKEPKKEKKVKKEKKAVVLAHVKPSLSRAAITKRIVTKVEGSTRTAIEIGVLLEDAKFYFYKGKKLIGTDHIEWATESFGFAKSQTHKYIKIGKVFGELEGFDGVPMGVLATMASDDKILNSAIEAQKQAKKDNDDSFKIDNVWLKSYNDDLAEQKRLELDGDDLTLTEELALYELEAVRELFEKLTGSEAGKKQEKGLRSKIASFDDAVIEKAMFDIDAEKKAEANKNATVKKEKFDKVEQELAVKEQELETMREELATAKENEGEGGEGPELLSARDKALHKLMSKLAPHAILNVEADAPKRDVNKAKRALEAIYSPKHDHGCESIWLLIEDAVKAMTK